MLSWEMGRVKMTHSGEYATDEDTSDVTCPFCGEDGFDMPGLKDHLVCDCEVFAETIDLPGGMS